MEKFRDCNILSDVAISQIHLSSKLQYETHDGEQRMAKELFSNLQQLEASGDYSKMPYYACESKLQLTFDDLFD